MINNLNESVCQYHPGTSAEKQDLFLGISSITLDAIGNYLLKEPITFTASFDSSDQLFCIENDSLAMHGFGVTFAEALSELREDIYGHALSYTTFPDEKHTQKSLELKARLLKHIDFDMFLEQVNKETGRA